MMPTTLIPDGSAVWVSGDRVGQVGPGTQQGTIRVLRLLKVVVGLGSNYTVNTEFTSCWLPDSIRGEKKARRVNDRLLPPNGRAILPRFRTCHQHTGFRVSADHLTATEQRAVVPFYHRNLMAAAP